MTRKTLQPSIGTKRFPFPVTRAVPDWVFGGPTLFAQGNGSANWERAERTSILATDQKSTTGWLAKLIGGAQTSYDDAGALYIPINEMPLPELGATGGETQWTYWLDSAQAFGCQISIWVHDPTDFAKRGDIIQSGSATLLDKGSGWNRHILNRDTGVQFFYYAENEGSPGLVEGPSNLYSLADFQADVVFKTWTIYRISFNNGFYNAGTFGDMYVADVKINGVVIPLTPSPDGLEKSPIVHLEKPFGKGNLTSDGVQHSAEVSTSNDTWTTVESITIEPPATGSIVGVEFGLTYSIKSSSTSKHVKHKAQARDKDGTWVDLYSEVTRSADASAYLEVTYSGRFKTVANFDAVPFEVQIMIKRQDSGENATGKVKNSSYVKVTYNAD